MEWFLAVVAVAILGVAAMAAAGGMGGMADRPVHDTFAPELPTDRQLKAADVQALRFGVSFRGYAMTQVDEVLDRLSREIAERDLALRAWTGSGPGAPALDHPRTGDDETQHPADLKASGVDQ